MTNYSPEIREKVNDSVVDNNSNVRYDQGKNGQITDSCPACEAGSVMPIEMRLNALKNSDDKSTDEFVAFYAEHHHMDKEAARKDLLDNLRVKAANNSHSLMPYSLEQYAKEKCLPPDYLTECYGLSTETDKNGIRHLNMPYKDINGDVLVCHMHYGNNGHRWSRGAKSKMCLYGIWMLKTIKVAGYVIISDGESSTQALCCLGHPALGVGDVTLLKPGHFIGLEKLKVYIHRKPGRDGTAFLTKITDCLRLCGYQDEVYAWSCAGTGANDPADLLSKYGKAEADRMITAQLGKADKIDLWHISETIKDAPINLRQPDGWVFSVEGIFDEAGNLVCKTPILLTKRLRNLDMDNEKMEIAFLRDGRWRTATLPRTTLFTRTGILELANNGCMITSENAKDCVKFFGALEAANHDVIPLVKSSSVFGWQPGRQFLPGNANDIVLDIDSSMRNVADAYCSNGTFVDWSALINHHRNRDIFRFLLASGFAAPLLKIINQRVFVVYNWCNSRGGKTAALKAALSIWGNPDLLMVNFNATPVGLERTAAFYCDLPLGVDERQLAGLDQAGIEKIIYMISSGLGKTRGAKNGGLQLAQRWRTIALMTGEVSLSTDTSQGGVSTRVLEIYGAPFEDEQSASLMHLGCAQNYGWAGTAFVRRLINTDDRWINEAYKSMCKFLNAISDGKNGAHVASVATVALADALADSWIFRNGAAEAEPPCACDLSEDVRNALQITSHSWVRAQQMAQRILVSQVQENTNDVNENAKQFIIDWVLGNENYFKDEVPSGKRLGYFSNNQDIVYILPSVFTDALEKAGYNDKQTKAYLYESGLIECSYDKKKRKYSVVINRKEDGKNKSARVVVFYLRKAQLQEEKQDEAIAPETVAPIANVSEACTYEVNSPGANASETSVPETSAPEAASPEACTYEVSEPGDGVAIDPFVDPFGEDKSWYCDSEAVAHEADTNRCRHLVPDSYDFGITTPENDIVNF